MSEGPEPARGTPAPLTQNQVDALVRGLDDEGIATMLERHSSWREEQSEQTRKRAPIRLSARDVAELARGTTPGPVAQRLEAAAKNDSAQQLERAAEEKERPTERPPTASRSRGS